MPMEPPGGNSGNTTKLYKRRWFFLLLLTMLQTLNGASFAMFGQISAFFVEYFNVSYTQADWMTLSADVAPLVTTLPLTYLAFRRVLGFRMISIACAAASAFGFACFTISMISRSFFAISVVGQTLAGLSLQLVLTTPSIFAALWFPENEVGTAIGVNGLGLYAGNTIGVMVPSYLLKSGLYNGTASHRWKWLKEDRTTLLYVYIGCFVVAFIITVLICVFVTDTPPKPPTLAQKDKLDDREVSEGNKSMTTFWTQTKAVLCNRTFLSASIIFGVNFQTSTMEFTMMAEIVQEYSSKRHLHLRPSIVGAWTMTYFSIGNIIGTIVAGKLVDKFKRYDRLSIIGLFFVFLSSITVAVGLVSAYQLFYVGNFCQGFFIQIALVTVYDMTTQQLYPIDETVVSLWMIGVVSPMGIFYGEIGRVLFDGFGGVGVLAFQCASMLSGFVLSFLLTPVYGRLDVTESCEEIEEARGPDEGDPLLNNFEKK